MPIPWNLSDTKTATKTAANNKSGMVRTIFKIKRDGTVIHFVLQYYLQRAMQLELMRYPKNVPTIAMRIVSNIGFVMVLK